MRMRRSVRLPSLFFFIGPNAFALRQERMRWKAQFIAKHGEENVVSLEGRTLSFRSLLDEIAVGPFIADKRLVMIDGVPKFEKEQVESLPNQIHSQCILSVWDAAPDKRLSGVKALMKVATCKDFPSLSGKPLVDWVRFWATSHGKNIDAAAIMLLLEVVGDDQNALSMEIEKLCAYVSGDVITVDAVRQIAVPSGEREVWHLTNLIAAGKGADAVTYADALLLRGEDTFALWNILLWMLRSLVSVTAAVEGGERNPAGIASQAGVPFPTAKTLLPFASRLGRSECKKMLDFAVDADIALKTGGFRATADSMQELHALITAFILRCTRVPV